jgi:hypothetical protein
MRGERRERETPGQQTLTHTLHNACITRAINCDKHAAAAVLLIKDQMEDGRLSLSQ